MKRLSTKFALTTISIMILSSVLAFMFTNFYYQQKLKPENDAKNTVIAKEMATFIEQSDETVEDYFSHLATVGYQFYVVDEEGSANFYGAPFRNETLDSHVIDTVLAGDTFHGMAQLPQETFVTGFFANELMNTIGVPFDKDGTSYAMFMRPNIKLLFNEIHILLAWLLVGTIVLSIIFVLSSARFLTRPISQLDAATQKVAAGNFSVQLDIDRGDEIGKLAESFTHMAKQLAALDAMKSDFIANVSHDIQTPLANIKGYTDLLQKASITEEEKNTYVMVIHEEITRLSALTKQLLLLASLEENEILQMKEFSLDEQIRTVIQRNLWLVEERELMISLDLQPVMVCGDETLLYNVWENLLTNAVKYNKEHGFIDIEVEEREDGIAIIFRDGGIGMDQATQSQLFERFYREDTARTRDVSGSGLGMSIVQLIVHLHGGEIMVHSEKNIGTTIQVILNKS